jgi:hypothetical protein
LTYDNSIILIKLGENVKLFWCSASRPPIEKGFVLSVLFSGWRAESSFQDLIYNATMPIGSWAVWRGLGNKCLDSFSWAFKAHSQIHSSHFSRNDKKSLSSWQLCNNRTNSVYNQEPLLQFSHSHLV